MDEEILSKKTMKFALIVPLGHVQKYFSKANCEDIDV
jgi:hypothetical protein